MEINGKKAWKCPNGHVLGIVRRYSTVLPSGQRYRITRLMLFRHAIDNNGDDVMEEVDVMALVEGTVIDVRCDICGATRTWQASAVALAKLLETVRGGRQ